MDRMDFPCVVCGKFLSVDILIPHLKYHNYCRTEFILRSYSKIMKMFSQNLVSIAVVEGIKMFLAHIPFSDPAQQQKNVV